MTKKKLAAKARKGPAKLKPKKTKSKGGVKPRRKMAQTGRKARTRAKVKSPSKPKVSKSRQPRPKKAKKAIAKKAKIRPKKLKSKLVSKPKLKKKARPQGRPAKKEPIRRQIRKRATAIALAPGPIIGEKGQRQFIPEIDRPTGMYGGVIITENPRPFPRATPYSARELTQLKEALSNERDRLRRELASMEGMTMGSLEGGGENEQSGYATHIAEHASDIQTKETILGVRTMEEERLAQVEEALARLESKRHYGLCLACGNKIGIERLIAKPHAHLCMDCRRIYERKRAVAGG